MRRGDRVPATRPPAIPTANRSLFKSKHALDIEDLPAAVTPEVADVFIMLGVIGGTLLLYLMASRIFPILNIWEQRELLMYKIHKPFHRTEVMVLGKPD